MMQRTFFTLTCLCIALPSMLSAFTLQQVLEEVIHENPTIRQEILTYQQSLRDEEIAHGGALPKVTFTGGVGFEDYHLSSVADDGSVSETIKNTLRTDSALSVTQNLFDGFATKATIDAQKARVKAAYYNLKNAVNTVLFSVTESYINLLRAYLQLQISKDNVNSHENIYLQIKQLVDLGAGNRGEFEQASSRLALAKSDHVINENAYLDAKTGFYRQVGRLVEGEQLIKPIYDLDMPNSLDDTVRFALKNHPQVIQGSFVLKSFQEDYRASKKSFYPSVDFELTKNWAHNSAGTTGKTHTYSAMIQLSYQLYNGGVDTATTKKSKDTISQFLHQFEDIKRQVTEQVHLSWNAHEKIGEQVIFQQEYLNFNSKTLDTYKQQFKIGRIEFLDMLNQEQEYNGAKKSHLNAELDWILSKFRIFQAMGILPEQFGFYANDYKEKAHVNGQCTLCNYTEEEEEKPLSLTPAKTKSPASDELNTSAFMREESQAVSANVLAEGLKQKQPSLAFYSSSQKDVLSIESTSPLQTYITIHNSIIRTKPNGKRIHLLLKNTPVKILRTNGNWGKIALFQEKDQWVSSPSPYWTHLTNLKEYTDESSLIVQN